MSVGDLLPTMQSHGEIEINQDILWAVFGSRGAVVAVKGSKGGTIETGGNEHLSWYSWLMIRIPSSFCAHHQVEPAQTSGGEIRTQERTLHSVRVHHLQLLYTKECGIRQPCGILYFQPL